ncbi:hypothetical protein SAMN05216275_113126 [Streptosporangium canum]|uniref:Phage integrase family protein n=1 Tax=Streptosporangium canum TaxID=324952 RepID=A0A1I3UW61_9ACTN|nr:hypothetical protein SAMN05216275_113126 [Streptosporangium canum]
MTLRQGQLPRRHDFRPPATAGFRSHTSRGLLAYKHIELLFEQTIGKRDRRKRGFPFHRLRHSRLTHLGEARRFAQRDVVLWAHGPFGGLQLSCSASPTMVPSGPRT